MLGRKGMAKLMQGQIENKATKMASFVGKDEFLKELKYKWWPYIRKHSDPDLEVKKARERISKSGPFKKTFEVVGVTDEDLREVIEQIQREKPEQVEVEEKVHIGRNEPCPCGSGKKYKKCCMSKGVIDGK